MAVESTGVQWTPGGSTARRGAQCSLTACAALPNPGLTVAQKAHEQIVDELEMVEIIEEHRSYLAHGVRQCEQALENARPLAWEMLDGWVAPHIVCPSVEWMCPNR
eukprot:3714013-Rhodomonas_salina.1